VQVLRGLLWGLFGFVGFFVILGALIERAGITTAFAAASAGALAIQAASLLGARTSADGVE
jgi:inner membrane protein involved in colicin E2 resistance